MHALRLDYQRSNKPVPWLGLGVLLAALAALALMGGYYRTLNQRIDFWESKVDRIERLSSHRAPASRPLDEQAVRARMLEVKQANQVLRQLSLPWNALFNAVETSGGQSIALLSMESDMQKGTLKISGEAKDLNALLTYVRKLSTREVFSGVFLQNHQIQQTDPEKPLRFSLLAYRKGAAP
jgi:Tfp pilus assembly protein PilN